MTQQKILAALAGCSSTNPMELDVLSEKTGINPDALYVLLDEMQHSLPAPINSAIVTRDGRTLAKYWPTGVVSNNRGPLGIVVNPLNSLHRQLPRRPELTAAKEQKTEQENAMNTKSHYIGGSVPSPLRKLLLEKIIQQPGISASQLVKHALDAIPGVTEKQALKTLSNIVHVGKQATTSGKRGNICYHPAQAAHKEPQKPRESAKPAQAPAPVVKDGLHIAIDDKDNLLLSNDHQDMELNPVQTARLHAFMRRVELRCAE